MTVLLQDEYLSYEDESVFQAILLFISGLVPKELKKKVCYYCLSQLEGQGPIFSGWQELLLQLYPAQALGTIWIS